MWLLEATVCLGVIAGTYVPGVVPTDLAALVAVLLLIRLVVVISSANYRRSLGFPSHASGGQSKLRC
jgi:ABC-type uncharacterized transport system permease subunit